MSARLGLPLPEAWYAAGCWLAAGSELPTTTETSQVANCPFRPISSR